MELMSSLLLCALVACLPQTLGVNETNIESDVRHGSRIYHQKSLRNKILLNLHGPPLVNMVSDLQYVFMDIRCRKCIECMERAIKAYKRYSELIKKRPTVHELQEEILNNKIKVHIRPKRDATSEAKLKKSKSKKKPTKSVTVTKYNVDGEVYGLRVKELVLHPNEHIDNKTAVCHIYSVKHSYECDTPASETFLAAAKRKGNNKKTKKEKIIETTTVKLNYVIPSFKKRNVDQSRPDIPENFETSIEDIMSY